MKAMLTQISSSKSQQSAATFLTMLAAFGLVMDLQDWWRSLFGG